MSSLRPDIDVVRQAMVRVVDSLTGDAQEQREIIRTASVEAIGELQRSSLKNDLTVVPFRRVKPRPVNRQAVLDALADDDDAAVQLVSFIQDDLNDFAEGFDNEESIGLVALAAFEWLTDRLNSSAPPHVGGPLSLISLMVAIAERKIAHDARSPLGAA